MTRSLHLSQTAPTPNLPAPGDVVASKYRIDRMLGMGGMGAVFEVTHCLTDKQFAIKWLLTQPADGSAESVRRFIREAQLAGRVKHPNVVEIYDVYQEPAAVFLVMELLEGESLAARISRTGPLSTAEALACMLGCLEGVAAAHAAGITHRDLKPANIFLCRPHTASASTSFTPKVLDFGVSRLDRTASLGPALTTTRSGTVIGTPHYMSLEQMRGDDVDARADVYSMGVTLYEVLSGVRPYDAETYPDLIVKVASGRPTPLEQLRPSVSPELAAVVRRAMAVDPAARYPTVESLMDALRPLALVDEVTTPTSQGSSRHAARAASVAAAVFVAFGIAVFLLWLGVLRQPGASQHAVEPNVPRADAPPAASQPEQPSRGEPIRHAPEPAMPPSAAAVADSAPTVKPAAQRPRAVHAPVRPASPAQPALLPAREPSKLEPSESAAPVDEQTPALDTKSSSAPDTQRNERKAASERPVFSLDRDQF